MQSTPQSVGAASHRTRFKTGTRFAGWICLWLTAALVTACGGSSGDGTPASNSGFIVVTASSADGGSGVDSLNEPDRPTTTKDASRFLHQSSFGPNAAALDETSRFGPRKALLRQMDLPVSQYSYTTVGEAARAGIHSSGSRDFCDAIAGGDSNCWRDYYSPVPVQWEFFRHAVSQPDQLRQRMAFIWSQIFVTSARELDGSYGFAFYHQMLRDHAFANFRTLLERVITSPFMGAYLNLADNDAQDPNENFAREMLQLFSIGACALNEDGSLLDGKCYPTYSNEIVRSYAYALTGWTYPVGGSDPWCDNGCRGNTWKNARYYQGAMVGKQVGHDGAARTLLSGVALPAERTPQQALARVLDSLMAHPNMAPFISRQLIQFLVTSNPTPDYVARVARVFRQGRYTDAAGSIGNGQPGDMRATVAAVLLDDEARDPARAEAANYGRLREPVQFIAGAIRGLDGVTDGDHIATEWGYSGAMGQSPFVPPSVFNYYPPDFPLTGTDLVAPQFGIESLNATLTRINFANALIYWWSIQGSEPSDIPGATGTRISYSRWESLLASPADSGPMIQALDQMFTSGRLGPAGIAAITGATDQWTTSQTWLADQNPPSNWKRERVRTALYLILSSPHYQVQR